MATILESYRKLHPRSAELYGQSLQTFPSGVTHDTRFLTPFPIYVDHAHGSLKWDVDDNEIIDFIMGHGALFLGHSYPVIVEAVREQMGKGTHYGASHKLELAWGQRVQELIPSAEVVRFTGTGTEATQMAIRLARAYTGRDKILKFDFHFHGWGDSLVGSRFAETDIPRSAGVPEATLSNTISVPQNNLGLVKERLEEDEVAAVILEPTGASWGTLPLADGFLADLRELTQRHNVLFICDEVITGFRVSNGGAQKRYDLKPDLTTLAKILAGGLPGGAVAGKADLLSLIEFREEPDWNLRRRVAHPGTYNANPLSAAAGTTMLSLIADGKFHRQADGLNQRLVQGMNEILRRWDLSGCAYGESSYFHIVLGKDYPKPQDGIHWPEQSGIPTELPRTGRELAMVLSRSMLNHGVDLMGLGSGFTSGLHTEKDIDHTLEAFEASVKEMQAEALL